MALKKITEVLPFDEENFWIIENPDLLKYLLMLNISFGSSVIIFFNNHMRIKNI